MIDWINERIRIRNRNDAPCSFSSVDAVPVPQPAPDSKWRAVSASFPLLPANFWKKKDTHAPIYVIHRDPVLSLYLTINL